MPRYEKSEIQKGAFITLDATGVGPVFPKYTPAHVHRAAPPRPPVRYGDALDPPDFSAISERLDEARARLEKLRSDLRATRGKNARRT